MGYANFEECVATIGNRELAYLMYLSPLAPTFTALRELEAEYQAMILPVLAKLEEAENA